MPMNLSLHRHLIVAMTLFSLFTMTCEAIDFNAAPTANVWKADARSQSARYVEDGNGGKALAVTWDEDANRLMEVNFKPIALPNAKVGDKITLWVCPTPKPIVNALALRVRDANGETFQISKKLNKQKPGWQSLTYTLSGNAAESNWGGQKNGKMELPIEIVGFATITAGVPTDSQTLIIDNTKSKKSAKDLKKAASPVSATPAQLVDTPTLVVDMSNEKNLGLNRGRGDKKLEAKIVDDEKLGKVYQINWGQGTKRLAEIGIRNRPSLKAFKKGVVLNIPVDNTGYPGLRTVGIRALDVNNEVWQWGTKVQTNATGWQMAQIKLSQASSTGHWGGGGEGKNKIDPPLRLQAVMALAPGKPTSEQFVRLGNITRNTFDEADIEPQFILQQLDAKFELPKMPFKLITPDTKDQFKVSIKNPTDKPITFGVHAMLEAPDAPAGEYKTSKPITLAAGESHTQSLTNMLSKFGWYRAHLTLLSEDGEAKLSRGSMSLAYMEPTGVRPLPPVDGFWFGIDARVRSGSAEWQVETCAMIGADYIRAGMTWPRIEGRGPGGSTKRHIDILDMLKKHGLKASYGLSFTPKWAIRKDYKGKPGQAPPEPEAWRNFAARIAQVNREHGGVISYEIWNEPDLWGFFKGTTDNYMEMLRIAYEEIEKHHPEATVISGGIATVTGHGGQSNNPDLVRRSYVEGQDHYEAMGLHQHGTFRGFRRALEGPMTNFRKKLRTPKPIWYTETGTPYHGKTKARVWQGQQLVKKHAYARAMNAQGFTWFVLVMSGENHYAMIGRNREPNASLVAYNTMTKMMRDKKFVQMHQPSTDNYVIEFAGNGEHLFVVWDEEPATTGEEVIITTTSDAHAQFFDIFGNASPVTGQPGSIRMAIQEDVRYLVVKSSQRPRVMPATVKFKHEVVGEGGKPITVKASVTNPLTSEATINLAWMAAGGQVKNEAVTIAAGKTADVAYTFNAPRGVKSGEQAPKITLAYTIEGTKWSGSINAPLKLSQLIPSAPIANREADFILESRNHIFNPNGHDPSRRHLDWAGVNDASARIWLGLEDQTLILRADVKDDKHNAPTNAGKMWQTDSIQFGFTVPGQTGYWELGLGSGADGPMVHVWSSPGDGDAARDAVKLAVEPIGGGLRYVAHLPLDKFGLTAQALREKAINFNLVVNDSDVGKREGWVEIAPHLGKGKDPDKFPTIRFE